MQYRVNWRVFRIKAGVTQKQLAKLAGVTQPRIVQIEQMKSTPSIIHAARIAAALNIHLNHFRNLSERDLSEFKAIYHLNKSGQEDNAENVDGMEKLIAFSEKQPYVAGQSKA